MLVVRSPVQCEDDGPVYDPADITGPAVPFCADQIPSIDELTQSANADGVAFNAMCDAVDTQVRELLCVAPHSTGC